MAIGAPSATIVFTSDKAAGSLIPGDFGGKVFLDQSTQTKPLPYVS